MTKERVLEVEYPCKDCPRLHREWKPRLMDDCKFCKRDGKENNIKNWLITETLVREDCEKEMKRIKDKIRKLEDNQIPPDSVQSVRGLYE